MKSLKYRSCTEFNSEY